ncbi:MAG: isoprenyl transferase [Candidatus Krumholzibacteria bacterium]
MSSEIEQQIEILEHASNLPEHIAVIMDGNGRWAKQRKLPRLEGHRVGRESVRTIIRTCARIGISYLTLYTFSLENWQRPADEVQGLMLFLEEVLKKEYLELDQNGVRLRTIGRIDMLPASTRAVLDETIEKLKNNTRLVLTLAISYGGRAEIIDATKRIARDARDGTIGIDDVDDSLFRAYLYDPGLPDPDLLIRTSGEVRISNFLLWQIAYTELFVTDVLWPDFREKELIESIEAYQKRERRFGL